MRLGASATASGQRLGLAMAGCHAITGRLSRRTKLQEAHDGVGREASFVDGGSLALICLTGRVRFKFLQVGVSDRLLHLIVKQLSLIIRGANL